MKILVVLPRAGHAAIGAGLVTVIDLADLPATNTETGDVRRQVEDFDCGAVREWNLDSHQTATGKLPELTPPRGIWSLLRVAFFRNAFQA